ncbi:MAG: ATP-binding protein [Rhodothermaceae bacterium]|nr:ATP-binding protein [Rhodothermaceae bacterium]
MQHLQKIRFSAQAGLILSILFQAHLLYAQHPALETIPFKEPSEFIINNWTTKDGLPVNFLASITRTSDGYLWIGSYAGLIRYDGNEFRTYSSSNTPGWIGGDIIPQACQDQEGRLWFAARSASTGNLYTLDNYNQQATATLRLGIEPITMRCKEENQIIVTHKDSITIINSLQDYKTFPAIGLKTRVGFHWKSRQDTFLYVMQDTLHYFINNQRTSYPIPGAESSRNDSSLSTFVNQIAINNDMMNMLLLAKNKILHFSNGTFSERVQFDEVNNNSPGHAFNIGPNIWVNAKDSIFEYFHEHIIKHSYTQNNEKLARIDWYFDQGLTDFAIWKKSVTHHRLLMRKDDTHWESVGVEDYGVKNIGDVEMNNEGLKWVSTDRGLFELKPRKIQMISRREGLIEPYVYSLLQDRSGALWVGTWGEGVLKLEGNSWKRYSEKNGLLANSVTTLYEDIDGSIFAGSVYGISKITGDQVSTVLNFGSHGLRTQFAREVHRDHSGNLWMSGTNFLEIQDGVPKIAPIDTMRSFRVIREFKKDTLLVGYEGGIVEYIPGTETWTGWPEFAGMSVVSLSLDPDSTLWVSTHGDGLIRKKGDTLFRYSIEQGLPTNVIHYTLDDQLGSFWIGSDNGLIQLSRSSADSVFYGLSDKVNTTVYTTEDGLEMNEFISGPNSAIRAEDGTLWFATVDGIAVVDPLNIEFNEKRPEMHITSLEFQGQPVDSSQAQRLKSGIGNTIEVQFRTNSLTSSKRRQYRYRLAGFEQEWHTSLRNSVRYTNLNPGKYTFEVFGTNNDGRWSLESESTSFSILPPFYQTWWFFTLCALVFVAALWLGYKQVMLKNELAMAQVVFNNKLTLAQTRIELADDLHDDIGGDLMAIHQSLDFLKSKESLGTNELHELARQSSIANSLRQKLRDHLWLVNTSNDSLLDLVGRMKEFLSTITSGIASSFKGPEDIQNTSLNPGWRRNVYLIYKEALQNAVKHAGATHIEVTIQMDAHTFSFSIKDNGKGMPSETFQNGRGMATMQRRAEAERGTLSIKSIPEEGTLVQFKAHIA